MWKVTTIFSFWDTSSHPTYNHCFSFLYPVHKRPWNWYYPYEPIHLPFLRGSMHAPFRSMYHRQPYFPVPLCRKASSLPMRIHRIRHSHQAGHLLPYEANAFRISYVSCSKNGLSGLFPINPDFVIVLLRCLFCTGYRYNPSQWNNLFRWILRNLES